MFHIGPINCQQNITDEQARIGRRRITGDKDDNDLIDFCIRQGTLTKIVVLFA